MGSSPSVGHREARALTLDFELPPQVDWTSVKLVLKSARQKSKSSTDYFEADTEQVIPETCPWCCDEVVARVRHVNKTCPIHGPILDYIKAHPSHLPVRDDSSFLPSASDDNPSRRVVPTGFILRSEWITSTMLSWSSSKLNDFKAHLSFTMSLAMKHRTDDHNQMVSNFMNALNQRANDQSFLTVTEYKTVIMRAIQV